jgi:hypothetical protein
VNPGETTREAAVKLPGKDSNTLADKVAQAKEMCMIRLRTVPRDKRESVADSIIALAEPEWWEKRQKGTEVFLLILEVRKNEVLKIMQDAAKS